MLLFEATHGADDPERANLPFIRANVAAAVGHDAAVHLVGEAVWMATIEGGCDVRYGGHPSVAEMADSLLHNGGRILLDAASVTSRGIALDGLRSGTELVTAAEFAALVYHGATTLQG
jgi:predicted peroxiredoxin